MARYMLLSRGTRILPMSAFEATGEQATQQATARYVQVEQEPIRVLLVEDEPLYARLIEDRLCQLAVPQFRPSHAPTLDSATIDRAQ